MFLKFFPEVPNLWDFCFGVLDLYFLVYEPSMFVACGFPMDNFCPFDKVKAELKG